MFGNRKTKGFALEATHLTNPDKLCTLIALLVVKVIRLSPAEIVVAVRSRPAHAPQKSLSPRALIK
jgi:hypothetical protein